MKRVKRDIVVVVLSSLARRWGKCLTIHSPPPLFKKKKKKNYVVPGSVHSGLVNWDDYGRMFNDKLRVSSLLHRYLHYAWTAAWSALSYFVGSRVYAYIGATCHLHLWQNDQGLLRATAVTRGCTEQRIRVNTQMNSGQENSPASPAGIQTRNLLITSLALLPTSYPRSHVYV